MEPTPTQTARPRRLNRVRSTRLVRERPTGTDHLLRALAVIAISAPSLLDPFNHKGAPRVEATAPAPKLMNTFGSPTEREVLRRINEVRARENKPPLTMDPELLTAAYRHNLRMAGGCGLSHQCPGEGGMGERFAAAGVKYSAAGENCGVGGPVGPEEESTLGMAWGLTDGMFHEKAPNDGHRQNLLTGSTRIGLSVYRAPDGNVWLTQDFAG